MQTLTNSKSLVQVTSVAGNNIVATYKVELEKDSRYLTAEIYM